MAPDPFLRDAASGDNDASGLPRASQSDPHENRPAFRFSLRRLFVAVAVAAVVFACVFYVGKLRERAQFISSGNDFKLISLSLQNFHDIYRSLPYPVQRDGSGNSLFPTTYDPTAKPLYSWRFAIVPFIEQTPWEPRYDKAWNSVENRNCRTACLCYGYERYSQSPADRMTKMFAVTGPGTAFGDGKHERPHSLNEMDADTLLVVEVRNSGLHWMAPGDFDIRTMPRTINASDGRGISGRYRWGFCVIFADGEVWSLSHETPFAELEKFFTIESANRHDREEVLRPYAVRG